MKKNRIIVCLIIILLLFLMWFLFINKTDKKEENKKLGIMKYNYESRVDKLDSFETNGILKYGWLQIQGTNIDLPIISLWDDEDVEYDYGWLVTSSFGYDTRKILAGHNILNVSDTPMVNDPVLSNFEDLMAFSYYDFAKDNMYLVYTEDGVDKVYVIYAVGFYSYDYEYDKDGLNKEDVNKYVKYVKENSVYNYGVDVKKDDDIITIKTCTRMFGVDDKQQIQIDARLLRKDEKMYKYDVKKTDLYKEYKLKDKYKNISS